MLRIGMILLLLGLASGCGRIGFDPVVNAFEDAGADATADAATDAAPEPDAGLAGAELISVSQLGGDQNDLCYTLSMNDHGTYSIAARFAGEADLGLGVMETSAGLSDIFVTTWSSDDSAVRSQTFGDIANQGSNGVSIDNSGRVFVTGGNYGAPDFGGGPLVGPGGQDWFIVGLDPALGHRWSLPTGSPSDEFGHDIAGDDMGGAVAVGRLAGDGVAGPEPLTHLGGTDGVMVRIDRTGRVEWTVVLGGALDDEATEVAMLPSGDVAVAGVITGPSSLGGPAMIDADDTAAFVALYSENGNWLWEQVVDGPGQERISGMGRDEAGNLFVAGRYSDGAVIAGQALPPADGLDGFAASFTPAGALRWVITSHGPGEDILQAIDARAGRAAIVGYYRESNLHFPEVSSPPAVRDSMILVVDSSTGALLWKEHIDEAIAVGVGIDTTGKVVAAGYFMNSAGFAGQTLEPRGLSDIFVARYRQLSL